MISAQQLDALDPPTRQAMLSLLAEVRAKDELIAQCDREVAFKQAVIDKLTHENAILKRLKFAAKSEAYSAEQKSLLEETLDSDLAAVAAEIEGMRNPRRQGPARSRYPSARSCRRTCRAARSATSPRTPPAAAAQPMQRIGEDVAEKLDYQPGVFTVERHVRGKWACKCCQKMVQAPVPAHVIDKGLPTAGLLAQVLVAKYLDHLPLYRQEHIFERAGHLIARSTLAAWVGECGAQLQPLVQALADELRRHVVLHADEDAGGHAQAQAPARR